MRDGGSNASGSSLYIEWTSLDFLNSKKGLALVGVLVGLGMTLLAFSGNPANMAMCAACFIRDVAGSMLPRTGHPDHERHEAERLRAHQGDGEQRRGAR